MKIIYVILALIILTLGILSVLHGYNTLLLSAIAALIVGSLLAIFTMPNESES